MTEHAGDKGFRVLFITQDDPFYVKLFFDEFFSHYQKLDEIAGVVMAAPMAKKSPYRLARQMYDFYGPADFLRVGMRFAAFRALDAVSCLNPGNIPCSIKGICGKYGIPVFNESRINSPEFLAKVREMAPDLIISVAAPVIFKKEIIGIPRRGCINIHHGMLPRYRGMLPNFWQMYHGEERAGITVHELNEKLDDGRIILQEDTPIDPEETLDNLISRTKRLGAHLMIKAIGLIRSGNLSYRENRSEEGSYFTFPTRRDALEFRRKGKRIL